MKSHKYCRLQVIGDPLRIKQVITNLVRCRPARLGSLCPFLAEREHFLAQKLKGKYAVQVFNAVKFTKKGHVVVRLRLAKSNGEPSGEVDVKLSSQEATARVMQLDPTTEHPAPVVQDVDLGGEIYDLEPTSKLDATWDPLLEGGRRGISHAEDEDIISLEHAVAEQDRRIVVSTGVAAMLGSNIAKVSVGLGCSTYVAKRPSVFGWGPCTLLQSLVHSC